MQFLLRLPDITAPIEAIEPSSKIEPGEITDFAANQQSSFITIDLRIKSNNSFL